MIAALTLVRVVAAALISVLWFIDLVSVDAVGLLLATIASWGLVSVLIATIGWAAIAIGLLTSIAAVLGACMILGGLDIVAVGASLVLRDAVLVLSIDSVETVEATELSNKVGETSLSANGTKIGEVVVLLVAVIESLNTANIAEILIGTTFDLWDLVRVRVVVISELYIMVRWAIIALVYVDLELLASLDSLASVEALQAITTVVIALVEEAVLAALEAIVAVAISSVIESLETVANIPGWSISSAGARTNAISDFMLARDTSIAE